MPKPETYLEMADFISQLERRIYGAIASYIEHKLYERYKNFGAYMSSRIQRIFDEYQLTDDYKNLLDQIHNTQSVEQAIPLLGELIYQLRSKLNIPLTEKYTLCTLTEDIYNLYIQNQYAVNMALTHLIKTEIETVNRHTKYKWTFADATAYAIAKIERTTGIVTVYEISCTMHGNAECEHIICIYLYLDCMKDIYAYLMKKLAEIPELIPE